MGQAGNPTIFVRTMQRADLGAAMRLKQAAGWNQTYADWLRFLALESEGSYVAASSAGRVLGTVTTCSFGRVGWIGMMLVEPAFRRRGIARRLMHRGLSRLASVGCEVVRLDATPLGAPLYRQLGFRVEREVVRFGGVVCRRCSHATSLVRPFRWSDWPQLHELDRQASGTDRSKLLKRLLLEGADTAWVVSVDGKLQGFALGRPGSLARFIGPVVAVTQHAGRALLRETLARAAPGRVLIDIPRANEQALTAAHEGGLVEQRRFERMVRGDATDPTSSLLWASSGPEKG